jgi:uncharacterized protein YndB with AHSA1/START domain
MDKPRFVYVTYISTTPETLWNALIDAKMTTQYWQHVNVSDWKQGSRWEHRRGSTDGPVRLVGKVLESTPPRRLVLSWADPADEKKEAAHTRVTFELEPMKGVVRLTVTHDRFDGNPAMLESISAGWPKVLSSLKTLLEGGTPLPQLW